MSMMERAESFTKLIQATCPDYVRLSIHPSSGQVKLSIPLIPQSTGAFPRSPWHCSIAVGLDGSYRTVHSKEVRESHNLIHRHGRPYFFREKSELFDWADEEGKVEFEHLYGGGCVVAPVMADAENRMLTGAGLGKLKKLAGLQSPVITRGFANRADGEIVA
ncbi:MAG: hypothetical protein M1840_005114 [Geoglossum simile]|nr:MAG: hypothetical protein M1840_005114 [Geoglossum simile]